MLRVLLLLLLSDIHLGNALQCKFLLRSFSSGSSQVAIVRSFGATGQLIPTRQKLFNKVFIERTIGEALKIKVQGSEKFSLRVKSVRDGLVNIRDGQGKWRFDEKTLEDGSTAFVGSRGDFIVVRRKDGEIFTGKDFSSGSEDVFFQREDLKHHE